MNYLDLHLNVTQDIGNGITIIFICCVFIIISTLLDLGSGVKAARKRGDKICSRNFRRTVTKIADYYRILVFGVMIDVLGLPFSWYNNPYCAMLVTLGVVLIESKSVLENYQKMKSAAAALPDIISERVECASDDKAEKIVKLIKSGEYGRKERKGSAE